jgi:hypothetical protein
MTEDKGPMSCPDRQSLERLLAGQLSAAESEAMAAHGEECDRCLELLAELSDTAATLPPATSAKEARNLRG